MSDGASIYSMISGLGRSFDDSYAAAEKARYEREAPDVFGKLIGLYGSGAAGPAPAITMGTIGQPAADTASPIARAPSFAATGGAMGDYLGTTRAKESGGNDLAANPNSTAKGRYQFTDGTWASVAKRHPELGLQPGGWKDPEQQERAMQAFTADNAKALTAAGIPINPGNLYVSHFLGEEGGPKFIAGAMSNPDAPAVAFVSPGAARANRNIFFEKDGRPKSAGAVYAERTSRYAGSGPLPTPTLPGAPGSVAMANSEAETQALESRMGMMPGATPQPTAQADMPAPGAQPAQFQIPGQAASAAAAPTAPQGFAGFGTTSSRMSPDQAAVLQAAWKNPVTRPMATEIYSSLLKSQNSAWKLQQMGDQPVLFNERTAQIVPVGQGKRQTATVGDTVVDLATGQPIYKGEKDDKFTYQAMPGVGMVALHPTDPDKSRVIIAGQQPRPLTADERKAYGLSDDTPAGMGSDGKPFGIGSGKTQVNVDTKGAGKFKEKANEIQAKRYGEIVDAADRAVTLRADVDALAGFAAQINTGKLAEARLGLAQYAKDVGLDSIANSLTGGKMGEMEAFSALADKLTPQMRVPGSGATSDREGAAFKNSLPSLLKTPGGNAIIADTFRGLADYQAAAGDIAGKALRDEISQAEADQALRALPSPYGRFKEYRAAQSGAGTPPAEGSKPAVAKGADRMPLPEGYSASRALAEAKASVKAGKDKAVIAERLSRYGIDPKRLDE